MGGSNYMDKIKLKYLEKVGLSLDTLEKVEDIISCNAEVYAGDISAKNVATVTRNVLIEVVKELYENLPISHIESMNNMEVIKRDYEMDNEME